MINIETTPFKFAYHKGQWVKVPLPYLPIKEVKDQTLPNSASSQNYGPAYNHLIPNTTETISSKQLSQTELEEVCKNNNIPCGWATNQYKKHNSKKAQKQHPSKRENAYTSLTNADYAIFIKKLKRINKVDAAIAQILWHLNGKLAMDNDFINREEILRISPQDIDLSDEMFTTITLIRSDSRNDHLISYELPWSIRKSLCQLIKNGHWYVFSNKNGGPLLSQNIARSFEEAGKQAGLKKSVTPLSLRPCLSASQKELVGYNLNEISIEEWEFCIEALDSKSKIGCPSKNDSRAVLNSIFYQLRTETSWRSLPKSYLPAKDIPFQAIHSQYRRWKKNGFLSAILKTRQQYGYTRRDLNSATNH
jgi:transposase